MDRKLAELITQAEFDATMKPIETALTPPAQAYNIQGWFDLEVERIFKPRWMAVMFDSEITNPGDVNL